MMPSAEAMARAEGLLGNEPEAAAHMARAREQAELISEEDDRELLEADLDSLS